MQPGPKILPLTSVRFLAALYVVLFHTVPDVGSGRALGRILQLGYISVSFFFTLSGFILAFVYLKDSSPLDKRRFWVARFARIYPLFVVTLLVAVPPVMGGMARRNGWGRALAETSKLFTANCLMLQVWDVRLRGLDNPNWSVAVETFFYLLFPLFAFLLRRRGVGALAFIATGFYLGSIVLVSAVASLKLTLDYLKFNPLLHTHEFVVGMCAGIVLLRLGEYERARLQRMSNPLLLASLAVFAVFFALYPKIPFLLVHDGLLSPIFVALIVALSSGVGLLYRILSHPWLVLLGEASFALYLLHSPIWIFLKYLPNGHSAAIYPLYLLAIVLLSIVSFLFLEGPSRRFILRHSGFRAQETVPAAAILR